MRRRGDDRGDGEVAVGDRGLGAVGQGHLADVDRIADIEAGDVDLDLVGDLVRVADQLELVADDVEHAAALEAGELFLVDEHHRHGDVDLACSAMRRKSTCSGRSVTGWNCTSLGSVRIGLPPTSTITTEFMKWPVPSILTSAFSSTWIARGSSLSP